MGRKNNLTQIIREAGAAGLSYGRYVAQCYSRRTLRKPIPKDYVSVNDRKRLGIGVPIYCGISTISAALPIDCPRKVDAIIEAAVEAEKKRVEFEAESSLRDQILSMYESGFKIAEIQSELQQPRSVIVEILRGADIGIRGKQPLPQEMITKMETTHAEGLSYEEIAKACGVSEKTVKNYLVGKEKTHDDIC